MGAASSISTIVAAKASTPLISGKYPAYQNLDNYSEEDLCQIVAQCGSAKTAGNQGCYDQMFESLTEAVERRAAADNLEVATTTSKDVSHTSLLHRQARKVRNVTGGGGLRSYLRSRFPKDKCLAGASASKAAVAASLEAIEVASAPMSAGEQVEAREAAYEVAPAAAAKVDALPLVPQEEKYKMWREIADANGGKVAGMRRLCLTKKTGKRTRCSNKRSVGKTLYRERSSSQECEGKKPCIYTDAATGKKYYRKKYGNKYRKVSV